MNARCDKGSSVEDISYKVNGGDNGLESRRIYYRCACEIF